MRITTIQVDRRRLPLSRDCYWEINLHLVWHTKGSEPTVTPEVEAVVFRSIRERVLRTPGAILHALGGIETHVHAAVSVPPTVPLAEWIGQLKGGSSRAVNQVFPTRGSTFSWQVGYGVVTFGSRDTPWVVRYVASQKEHHAAGTAHERLERTMPLGDSASSDEEQP